MMFRTFLRAFSSVLALSSLSVFGGIRTGENILVSSTFDGVPADNNNISMFSALSADGSTAVFWSDADNLSATDTNSTIDTYAKDLLTGELKLVSCSANGAVGNNVSRWCSVSADGRLVAFGSQANNLIAGDTNDNWDVFVKHLDTGAVEDVSTSSAGVQGNGTSWVNAISADGRYVAFFSTSTNLAPGATNGLKQVYVKDRQTGQTYLASASVGGFESNADCGEECLSISADGRYVAFSSTGTNLVAGDTNGFGDVFVKDMQTGAVQRVSTSSNSTQADGSSSAVQLSAAGNFATFQSNATNLVASGSNGFWHAYLKDLGTGATVRVDTAADGTIGNADAYFPVASANGRYVAFSSRAMNLVSGVSFNNYTTEDYIKDLQTGQVYLESVSATGVPGNANSLPWVAIDPYANVVVFGSSATNLVGSATNGGVFARGTGLDPLPTKLNVGPGTAYVGKKATLTGTLRDKTTLAPIAYEKVAFRLDGVLLGSAITDSNGKAVLPYPVPETVTVGSHTLKAVFAGDAQHRASWVSRTLDVQPGPVRIMVPAKSVSAGGTVVLSAKLTNWSYIPLPNETLSFTVDGGFVGTGTTNDKGVAKLSIAAPAVGSHTVTVEFSGDGSHTSGSGSGTLTVS